MTAGAPKRIAVVGTGAVGGWIGGNLAQAGFDVTLIDAWPEHVSAMQSLGLRLTEPGNERVVKVNALHIGQVQSLYRAPLDLVFLCVKLYDTDWAATLIAPYLAESGYIVTMQNSLIEDRVAAVVGWERTVGCIGGGVHVGMVGPGHVNRTRQPGSNPHKVFHVGEVHGRITPRVQRLADILETVDKSEVTTNLWGFRWSKLVANCMTSALCGVSGLPIPQLFSDPTGQRLMIQLAAEAITAGGALGFEIENVFGLATQQWLAAAAGEAQARARVGVVFENHIKGMSPDSISGTAQDFAKNRRTEVDYMNGYVVARACEAGTAAPTHSAMAALVGEIEAGRLVPGRQAMNRLPAG